VRALRRREAEEVARREDKRTLEGLKSELREHTPLDEVTARRTSEDRAKRLAARSRDVASRP
jgi:hypothetical protein